MSLPIMHATTIIAIRKNNETVFAGDGQVSLGNTIIKASAEKIRSLSEGSILVGFAGSTADAFSLLEKLEGKLEKYPKQLLKSCVELAKDWRNDKYLRKLEAMMIVANSSNMYLLSGLGDVLEPEEPIIAIGSGGNYALSSAKALFDNTDLTAERIATISMSIAAEICVYTNTHFTIKKITIDPKK